MFIQIENVTTTFKNEMGYAGNKTCTIGAG